MANDFNQVNLLGRLARDPEMKYLQSNTPVVSFGMAVGRKYKTASGEEREEVAFVDCSAFGKPAEIINQYCRKGHKLLISGRLKQDNWEDKTTGQKRSKLTVVIENFHLQDNRKAGEQGGEPAQSRGPSRAGGYGGADRDPPHQDQAPDRSHAMAGGDEQFADNEIPF